MHRNPSCALDQADLAEPLSRPLLTAVHRPQFGQDEPHGAVEAHDHRGQYLHIVANGPHFVAHRAQFVEHPLLVAGDKFERDRIAGHGTYLIYLWARAKRKWSIGFCAVS